MANKLKLLLGVAAASSGIVLVEYLTLLEVLMGCQILSTTELGRSHVLETLFEAELPDL